MAGLEQVAVALFVITVMLSVGLELTLGSLREVLRSPRLLGLGLGFNYLVMPGLALGLGHALSLDTSIVTALLLLSAAPGGPVGAMFTAQGGGNIAYSAALIVLMNLANTVLTPGTLVLAGLMPDTGGPPPTLEMIRTILLVQVIPLSVGVWCRHARPTLADRLVRPVKMVGQIILVGLIVFFLFKVGPRVAEVPPMAAVCVFSLVGAGMVGSWLLPLGGRPERVALCMTTTIRSMSVVVLLITRWFPEPVTLLVALSYSTTMFLSAMALLVVWRLRSR